MPEQAGIQFRDVGQHVVAVEEKLHHAEQNLLVRHVHRQHDLADGQRRVSGVPFKQWFPKNIFRFGCLVHPARCDKQLGLFEFIGAKLAVRDVFRVGNKEFAIRRVQP